MNKNQNYDNSIEVINQEETDIYITTSEIVNKIKVQKTLSPEEVFQYISKFILTLCTQDPSKIHFYITRLHLKSLLGKEYKYLEDYHIDRVTREFLRICKEIKKRLVRVNPFKKQLKIEALLNVEKNIENIKCSPTCKPYITTYSVSPGVKSLNLSPEEESKFEISKMFATDKVLYNTLKKSKYYRIHKLEKRSQEKLNISKSKYNYKDILYSWFHLGTESSDTYHLLDSYSSIVLKEIIDCSYNNVRNEEEQPSSIIKSTIGVNQKVPSEKQRSFNQEFKESIEVSDPEQNIHMLDKLTTPEYKAYNALDEIFWKNSQTYDSNKSDYCKGNRKPVIVEYGNAKISYPVIEISAAEFFKLYAGQERLSGQEQREAHSALISLSSKSYAIVYERKYYIENNGKREERSDVMKLHEPLIKIAEYSRNLSKEDSDKFKKEGISSISSKGKLRLIFHPIFSEQMDKRYIKSVKNKNKRLKEAAKKNKTRLNPGINKLIDHLERCLSNVHSGSTTSLNESKLISMLGLENDTKTWHKKRAIKKIEKNLNTCISYGIINSYFKEPSKTSQNEEKYTIKLNTKYPEHFA